MAKTESSPAVAREVHLVERPEGRPTPGQFAIVERQLPALRDGEFLIANKYLSIDPAMRPPLSNGLTPLNAPITNIAVGQITASNHEGFEIGNIVAHRQGMRDFAVSTGEYCRKLEVEEGEPLHWHLGPLGVSGITAYAGLFDVASIRPGERVFVSAAAGAVGSLAAQMAKLSGCTVIGSAGGPKKVEWLESTAGLDAVIDYKDGVLRKTLKAAAPDGIDVYFDNVGGEHLNAALPRMRLYGRVAICGMISAYNNKGALSDGVTTLPSILYKRVTLRAFIWEDHKALFPQFQAAMRKWLRNDAIKAPATVVTGLENAPNALIGLFTGENLGKMIVEI
ncbi:MAG: NADP-dependent oxidoreductase [Pseudomonadota bacterium]